MKKKKNIFTLIAITIILILGPVALLRKAGKSSAAWPPARRDEASGFRPGGFNEAWGYRKAVNITNSSGSALTDFQVSINIGTSALIASGKMIQTVKINL